MCVNISNLLYENGHDVTLCATRAGGPLEKSVTSGIKLHILGKKSSADFVTFRRFISIIKDNGIEIIHAHSSSLFWAIAAKFFIRKVKVIWHDHLGLRVKDRKNSPIYRLLSGKIDGIIAVNEQLVDWSRKNMKVPAERILMINNFPLLKDVDRHPDPEFFTIVCLANLRPQKDHETLVRAVALLKEQDLPKKLKVILAGSHDDVDYFRKIKDLIQELGYEKTIEMPGSVEDTSSLLASVDCGVLSSVSEGLPVSLLEYGMAGLPVVVTDVGHCTDVVGNGLYGKVVGSGDAIRLSEELLWIFTNPAEAHVMGEKLKEHIENKYGPGNFMTNYLNLLAL